jgi:hypothetical protein
MSYFIPGESFTHIDCSLKGGVDAITRSTLLKLLLHEAETSCPTSQRLDAIDRHIAELRQLIYRQVELFEKGKLRIREAEQVQNHLATLNDLMANYQTLRRRMPVEQATKFELVVSLKTSSRSG